MRSIWILAFVLFVLVAGPVVWLAQPGGETSPTVADQNLSQPTIQRSSMVAHIDPETGEFLETPPPTNAIETEQSSSEFEFVEEPVPGGGVMINLQGKFQLTSVATVGGDSDKLAVECMPKEQAPDDSDVSDSSQEGGN